MKQRTAGWELAGRLAVAFATMYAVTTAMNADSLLATAARPVLILSYLAWLVLLNRALTRAGGPPQAGRHWTLVVWGISVVATAVIAIAGLADRGRAVTLIDVYGLRIGGSLFLIAGILIVRARIVRLLPTLPPVAGPDVRVGEPTG